MYTSALGTDPVSLLFVVLLTSLGTWGLPQMVGKFYSIKDNAAVKKGTVISTVFALVVAGGCYFLGGFGRLYGEKVLKNGAAVPAFDTIIPTMLSTLPPIIIALVVVLVLSASMSTLSSLVLTSSSTLTLDVIVPRLQKNGQVSEKRRVFIMRVFIVFFIAISSVIALLKDSLWKDSVFIAQMMGVSWGALAGAFLAPFLYGLYWKRTSKTAVAVSFIFGVTMELIQLAIGIGLFTPTDPILSFVFKNSLYSGVFAMVGGLVLVPIVSLLSPKTVPEE